MGIVGRRGVPPCPFQCSQFAELRASRGVPPLCRPSPGWPCLRYSTHTNTSTWLAWSPDAPKVTNSYELSREKLVSLPFCVASRKPPPETQLESIDSYEYCP
eukprot:scaffold23693_cov34-Prasinocladus_malaysianus.AAC.1